MAKHRRWADKNKQQSTEKEEVTQTIEENPEIIEHAPTVILPTGLRSTIRSVSKYVYIITAAALLCGIFTPITLDYPLDTIFLGVLTVFLGLGGSIVIFLGIKSQKFRSLMICGGLGIMIVSLVLIYEMAQRPIL